MVGNNKRREHVADGDGSKEEGKDGKGDGDGNEGTGQRRGQGIRSRKQGDTDGTSNIVLPCPSS